MTDYNTIESAISDWAAGRHQQVVASRREDVAWEEMFARMWKIVLVRKLNLPDEEGFYTNLEEWANCVAFLCSLELETALDYVDLLERQWLWHCQGVVGLPLIVQRLTELGLMPARITRKGLHKALKRWRRLLRANDYVWPIISAVVLADAQRRMDAVLPNTTVVQLRTAATLASVAQAYDNCVLTHLWDRRTDETVPPIYAAMQGQGEVPVVVFQIDDEGDVVDAEMLVDGKKLSHLDAPEGHLLRRLVGW